jgi:hypothetical protein
VHRRPVEPHAPSHVADASRNASVGRAGALGMSHCRRFPHVLRHPPPPAPRTDPLSQLPLTLWTRGRWATFSDLPRSHPDPETRSNTRPTRSAPAS